MSSLTEQINKYYKSIAEIDKAIFNLEQEKKLLRANIRFLKEEDKKARKVEKSASAEEKARLRAAKQIGASERIREKLEC